MRVFRESFTLPGVTVYKDLPITQEEVDRWEGGELIQDVWPNLSPADREFIVTGMDDEDWDILMTAVVPFIMGREDDE